MRVCFGPTELVLLYFCPLFKIELRAVYPTLIEQLTVSEAVEANASPFTLAYPLRELLFNFEADLHELVAVTYIEL